jgi:ubiquinone/menaquinone biosynthesis C-methylase UbiE
MLQFGFASTLEGPSSIDIIISNSFFEHLEDPEEIIKEMARITARGGLSIHAINCVMATLRATRSSFFGLRNPG